MERERKGKRGRESGGSARLGYLSSGPGVPIVTPPNVPVFSSPAFSVSAFSVAPWGAHRSHVTKAVARPGGLPSLANRETLMTTAGDNSAINADAFWRN